MTEPERNHLIGLPVEADLVAWLTQIWDEEVKVPRHEEECGHYFKQACDCLYGELLARIAADRQILAMHAGYHECPSEDDACGYWMPGAYNPDGPPALPYCPTVRVMASLCADQPGFRDEWRVTA